MTFHGNLDTSIETDHPIVPSRAGQPKRHLLTTGWSVFVSTKRLLAGDSVLFIRMLFETEDSGVRRYMGTITGIGDLDPVRWKNSHWRNLQVGWDESTASERRTRVSIWEIEPVATPFYICPPPFFRPKLPKQPGMPDDENEVESAFKRAMPWLADDFALKDVQNALFPGLNLVQWMAMQQNPQMLTAAAPAVQSQYLTSNALGMQDGMGSANEDLTKRLSIQAQNIGLPNIQTGSKAEHPASTSLAQHQQQAHHVLQHQQVQPLQQNSAILQQQQAQLLQQNAIHLQQQQEQLQRQQSQPPQQLKAAACIQPMDQHKLKEQQPSSGQVVSQAQLLSQILQPSSSQLQQLGLPKSPTQRPGLPGLTTMSSMQQPPLNHTPQVQPTAEFQQALLQGQQPQLQQLSQSELQLQLLQKIQQQNLLSQLNPQHQSQLLQQLSQKSQEMLQQQVLQHQFGGADAMALAESEEPSSSTAPSGSRISPINSLSRAHQGSRNLPEMPATPQIDHLLQEIQSKSDNRVKTDMQDESPREGFSFPPVCLDSNVQVDPRDNFLIAENVDTLMPDALLSRGMSSGKGISNLPSAQRDHRDMENELSSAAFSSQSFGVPDMSFKPGCSNDVAVTDGGMPSQGLWNNQTQRMRTFTKVQKRGSVGRSIDITRYQGYDDLRHDLACMFGIQGQLKDPYRTDWKLVYVDHENDILLVGDDPWEEFVSCVKSIKILSSAEVQQMSLDGDLGCIPPQTQACSASDDANAWRS
ncbi:hypothetical protein PR202_gb17609 [Eleusine coracana subsp. coracana]|uniref:Auxin-responsive protein n=1 Tax=Eleusine coracana subsp. coracana TaxID=191504 RepID=A0AAV5F4X3_ELECO|nr:hypothetical protein PR202_gb17609 [Eleusine coracana subsp. coracana]